MNLQVLNHSCSNRGIQVDERELRRAEDTVDWDGDDPVRMAGMPHQGDYWMVASFLDISLQHLEQVGHVRSNSIKALYHCE